MNVPKLRFKEFNGEWKENSLGKLVDIKSGISPSSYNLAERGNYPFLKVEDLNNCSKYQVDSREYSNDIKNVIPRFSVIFPKRGAAILLNKVRVNINEVLMDSNLMAITPNDNINVEFLYYKIIKDELFKIADTSTIPQINNKHILPYKVTIPSKQEQEKIASFLTSVDTKIEQLTKKEQLLQQYKKGVMQKIFSQEIRFKADDGSTFPKWEEKKLNKYLYEHKEKNFDKKYTKNDVLSVSGEYGIVNQIELKGRSFAGESIDNYHFVDVGDVVYTKSPLKVNPYGIVKTNKKKAGVVSTLYAVYRPKENLNPFFIDYYFQLNDNINKYFRPLVQKGAKNDMKINNSYAISDPVLFPEKKEQTKIANFLSSIDSKIEQVQKQLNSTKEFKKALLQQMFV